MPSLDFFFNPKSIAVIGASRTPSKIIYIILVLFIIVCSFSSMNSSSTPPSKYGVEISTAIDLEGFIHVVFSAYDDYGHKSVYIKIDSATGNVIIPPITLPSEEDGVYPDIVVDSNGCAHIVYQKCTINGFSNGSKYVKLDKKGNVTFNQEVPVFCRPHIAIDSQDRIYIIWRNGTEYNYCLFDINGTLISENNIEPPSGYEIIVDQTQFEFYVIEKGYNSLSFSWPTKPSTPYELISTNDGKKLLIQKEGWDYHETKIVDKKGNIHFFFRADDLSSMEDNYLLHYQKVSSDGKILISKNSFSEGISFPQCPNTELDSDGNIHLIWWGYDNNINDSDVFYVKLDENGNKVFAPYSITKYTCPQTDYYFDILFVIIFIITLLIILMAIRLIKRKRHHKNKM